MRLHRLRLSAFQAFAGTEEVDFDALGAAGLFLLHGDTGAGKTTLLDAIAFALYGRVPGARAQAARLRSDHAAADLRTEVELEVTLRERRVRIVRRPAQERPKLRGEGMTEEGHACTVEALEDDGTWTVLAARPDEARAELGDLLGMTCDQFCQVVLLPQGEFAAFLRAGSDERWRLLERLFGTERFAQVEWWLRDRAREARAELGQQLGAVRDVVARLAQASGEEPPGDWEAGPAELRAWAGGLSVGAQATAVTAQEAAAGARGARAEADAALAAARDLAERQRRHATAKAELESWQAKRGVRDEAERVLSTARAAAPVAPLLAAAAARVADAAEAERAKDEAWEALDEASRTVAEEAAAAAAATASAAVGAPAAADPSAAAGDPAAGGLGHAAPAAAPPVDAQISLFELPPEEVLAPATAPTGAPAEPAAGASGAPAASAPAAERAAGGRPATPAEASARALRERAGELRTHAGALGELAAVEQRLEADEQALARLRADAEAAEASGTAAARALDDASERRVQLDAALLAARRASDRLDALAQETRTAAERAAHAVERDRLAETQRTLDDRVRAAVDAEQTARTAWLDVRERRLAGMAAELAADLAPGEPCAVCGSLEHPAPAHEPDAAAPAQPDRGAAVAGPARPTDATAAPARPVPLAELEQAAQEAHARRARERAGHERAAAENAAALAAARAVAGDAAAEELRATAVALEERLDALRAEAGGLPGAERALAALATAVERHERERRDAEQAAAAARTAHAERSKALAADRERVVAARGDDPTIAARVERLFSEADACEQAASAAERAARAASERDEAVVAAAEAAADAGFASPEDASAAVRAADEIATLEQRLRAFDEGVASRSALLEDPALIAAAAEPAPDLAALQAAAERAREQDEACQSRNTVEQQRLTQVTSLAGALDTALTALAPVAERERVVRELAALVDGASASNRLRMRLSAYVLAARLEEVAAAATARLERMSNGRYALIHADDGARGRRRGGLDLKVVDGWTGQERSPATLSGGETFLASLALALGLADVVAAEAGGSRLETLFIDEGFGSLDERTLDEVLDVLDTLREGGRAVGIVSHVAELRQRIPAKLHVVKGRNGSHVEQDATTVPA